jgi:hypothetical protein
MGSWRYAMRTIRLSAFLQGREMMSSLLNAILNSSLIQAQIMKAIRWGATVVSGAAVAFLVKFLTTHGFVISTDMMTDINNFGTGLAGGIIALATLFYSLRDAKHVDTALKASAQMGEVVSTANAKALEKGDTVTLPSGQQVVLGKPSPSDDPGVTAALNKSEIP